jgi:Tfp pilus assembly protein PilZ
METMKVLLDIAKRLSAHFMTILQAAKLFVNHNDCFAFGNDLMLNFLI